MNSSILEASHCHTPAPVIHLQAGSGDDPASRAGYRLRLRSLSGTVACPGLNPGQA